MDPETREIVQIRRLERQIANLEARVRELEEEVGIEPALAGAFSADQPSQPTFAVSAAAPLTPPPAPMAPPNLDDQVAAAWVNVSRAYGIDRPAQAAGAIPGWGQSRATPSTPAASWTPVPSTASTVDGWGPASPDPSAPSTPLFTFDLHDLEERFAGRAMAWIGGAALIGAAVFFLSLAFSRGWIGEELRVAIGLVAGTGALVGGALLFDRRSPMFANVLVAVGLGIVSIALFAATRGYGLVAPEFGLAGAFLAAAAAAVIAIRYDAKEVAAFGLLAALAAPPVMGASPNLLTLLFVAVILVCTTAIALFRTWPRLPALAFMLAAPQLASYLAGGVGAAEGLIALVGFWVVNVTAAAGEEWRIRRDSLKTSSATLVLANATFALWGGYLVLTNTSQTQWLGTFVGVLSVVHLLLGGWFLRRQGLNHLFGNLVAGTGIALVAIAAFVQLGAPVVPLAWAAEATALAWLSVRRMHKWSALAALALGGLAVTHVVSVEYPLYLLRDAPAFRDAPWLNAEGASVLSVVAALALTAILVPVRWIRSALIGLGVLLVEYAAMFEVRGAAFAATLVVVALAAVALERVITARGTKPQLAAVGAWLPAFPFAASVAAIAGIHAAVFVIAVEFPASQIGVGTSVPYATPSTLSLIFLMAGLVAAGRLLPDRGVRSLLGAAAVLVVGWTLGTQFVGLALVAALAALLPLAVVLERGLARLTDHPDQTPFRLPEAAGVLAAGAGVLAWLAGCCFATLHYLVPMLAGERGLPATPFLDETAAAALALIAAAVAAARWTQFRQWRTAFLLGAVVTGACVVPLEVYADLIVPLWLVLAGLAMLLAGRRDQVRTAAQAAALILGAGAVVLAFGVVTPVERLWVQGGEGWMPPPLMPAWPVALGFVIVALGLAGRLGTLGKRSPWLSVGAAAVFTYMVSVGVVDIFQRQAGGATAREELAIQAQVAMSVCWTIIGVASLAWGLAKGPALARHVGLGLLGIATLKVFVVDLASMDVAYRAVVLAGLGVLLMLAAGLYTRLRRPQPRSAGGPKGTPAS